MPLSQIQSSLRWRSVQPGLQSLAVQLHAGALKLPIRAIITRVDPRAFDLELVLATRANGMTGAWTVDSAGAHAAFAFNAGQFKETGPWGWLVLDSYERRDPGYGPLSVGVAVDTGGALRWIGPAQLAHARMDRTIRFAFQSYPVLLLNGRVPKLLHTSGDVDRKHRDARLILAELPDRSLLIALTRYDALVRVSERIPIGLTVPESVALMQALGARHAVMLDGGISAQLLVRDSTGAARTWKGLRQVPLALIGRPRRR